MDVKTRDLVVKLFADDHWSCNMIAKEVGFTRNSVWKFLNHAGYDTTKAVGRHMTIECLNCGNKMDVTSALGRKKKYCSLKCYYEWVKDGEYRPWRHGQRIAREILRPYVHRLFGKNQDFVSHHEDGDDTHNELRNMKAFPDQSNHLAYHRHHRIACILIDGNTLQNWLERERE